MSWLTHSLVSLQWKHWALILDMSLPLSLHPRRQKAVQQCQSSWHIRAPSLFQPVASPACPHSPAGVGRSCSVPCGLCILSFMGSSLVLEATSLWQLCRTWCSSAVGTNLRAVCLLLMVSTLINNFCSCVCENNTRGAALPDTSRGRMSVCVGACLCPGCSLAAETQPWPPGSLALFAQGTHTPLLQQRPGEQGLSTHWSATVTCSLRIQPAITSPCACLAPLCCGTSLV